MVCDREAMYETIEALCADSMAGRRAASGGDLRAARMLAGMMEKAGCKPLWEEAVVPFHLENTMKALHTGNLDFAKRFFAGPWRDSTYNVTMVIRSGYPDAPKVVLGAHYDHIGKVVNGDSGTKDTLMLRGANDNASGAVAVTEIARRLRPYARDFKRDLVLTLFATDDMATLHQATDTPESLNMEGMERVVNYIMRNVYALLTAERLPSPNRTQEAQ